MRIGIYARVSTKDQSCELQLRDLRSYCAARGFDLVREYVDVGQSGAKDSRPELNKLMDDARKRQFDAIVVWRFDRFARSTKHLLSALEEFRSLGIQFISYQENIDTSSALGQALFTIVSAVAQLERDLIRERVSAGIRNARAKGTKFGRPMRAVDPDLILQMRGEGQSLRQIADNLGVGYGTVRERLKEGERKTPRKTDREEPRIKDT
ncbi:MAG: recombinase family protein [Acidobacteriia bacterium]|nr:recombinase family protein [Terriglobia bacterium]